MRKRLQDLLYTFTDIHEQIKDVQTVLNLYEERLEESAEESITQSLLRGQLKLLDMIKKECEDFSERLDQLSLDYLHGRVSNEKYGIYARGSEE